jgi:hypothetical protein
MGRGMPLLLASLLSSLCALGCAGCIDLAPGGPPQARVVVYWDPLACGEPHRVAVDLLDDAGAESSMSAPCALGEIAIDLPHFGAYHGWSYARVDGEAMRSVAPVELAVDDTVVRWRIETPR